MGSLPTLSSRQVGREETTEHASGPQGAVRPLRGVQRLKQVWLPVTPGAGLQDCARGRVLPARRHLRRESWESRRGNLSAKRCGKHTDAVRASNGAVEGRCNLQRSRDNRRLGQRRTTTEAERRHLLRSRLS